MPIGFAKNILAQGTTATGANAFVDYDGSNDQTLTRNAAVQGFLGFAPFNDEYGVSMVIIDAGGFSQDLIRYDVLRNNSGTLSIANQDQSYILTSSNNYTNFKANIHPTNGGNIYTHAGAGSTNDAAILSISGSTVTKHTAFNSPQENGLGGRMFRRPGTDQFVHILSRSAQIMTLTDNGNSSSSSMGSDIYVESSDMYYNNGRAIHGFKDANTVLFWKSINNASGDISSIQPFELDLTTTGSQSPPTPVSGVSAINLDLNSPNSSNAIDFGNAGSSPFETTDFNNTLMFWERKGSGTPGRIRVHHYTPGDSSITSSNTLVFSSESDSDISPTGCFVGTNNDVFLFAMKQEPNSMVICKFVKSTNTLSEILKITETFNVEKCRMSRWGDGAALLTYNDVKMRLIKP